MLDKIRLFLKVVEAGSFNKAAQALNMSPSSLTRQVDKLEAELKVSLLKRSTRSLQLTSDGRRMLDQGSQLLLQADTLKESFSTQGNEPTGRLKVSVFETFGRVKLCPLLDEFMRLHPKIDLHVDLDNQFVDLNKEEVDVAIRIGIPADSSLVGRRLLSNQTVLCASPEYFKLKGCPQVPEELVEHNCLKVGELKQRNFWYFRKQEVRKKILIKGRLSSKGGTPILQGALSGLGIALLPLWILQEHVNAGRLTTCLDDWGCFMSEQSCGEVYAMYHASSRNNPLVRIFMDFLTKNFPLEC